MVVTMRNKNLILLGFVLVCALSFGQAALYADDNPRIVASPEYLVFNAVAGSTTKVTQTFTVGNGGPGTLSFTMAEGTGWLNMSATSGSVMTNKAAMTVTIDPTGLSSAGSPYTGDITISNTNFPQDI